MTQFWLYFNLGLHHVLDIQAFDHILFLIALLVPYSFKNWKRVLLLVTLFTIGHTLSLLLSVYNIVSVNTSLVELLILITIFITALYHLFTAGKTTDNVVSFISIITLFFGIIHGLGFSTYFKTILPRSASDKLVPLLEFALGIEAAQVLVVIALFIISYAIQTIFRFSKRDWALVLSALVLGAVIPMLLQYI